jgi:AcrR family transcriptional regulator
MNRARRASRATGRTNDPAGVRARVLDAAAGLFQTNGYHGTTMGDVIRGAGVSAGAMHHHYPSKKTLGLAVIRERVGPAVRETWVEPVIAAPSAFEGVKAVMDGIHADLTGRGGVNGCPLNNLALELSLVDKDFQAEIALVFADWQAAIAARIAADQARGCGPLGSDPDQVAALIVAGYSGAMAMAKARQDPEPLRICGEALLKVLIS